MRSGKSNKPAKTAPEVEQAVASSGNVFADLGLPSPDIALAKAELVQRIRQLIIERRLTQEKAGVLLGLDQPKVSGLVRGRVDGYTLDRLFRFLNAFGQEIEINVRPSAFRKSARGRRAILVRS